MNAVRASAPGKVILLGEHGVNRRQPALAAAIDRRASCRVTPRADGRYGFRSGDRAEETERERLLAFKRTIDGFRAGDRLDDLKAATAGDFFAPARYVLAHVVERLPGGFDLAWRSDLPIGAGLGSGAAANAAMVAAVLHATGETAGPQEVAHLAWQGDIVAHGGVASGLDSGACALGGVTRYTLAGGSIQAAVADRPTLVVADTGVQAATAEVNTRVRRFLAAHPERMHLFPDMGLLVETAHASLETGNLERLGRAMNLGQLLLEKLGVSCPEIERLVEAALAAGALGAKLSGSGGGGIVIALPWPGEEAPVVAAMTAAGGTCFVTVAGAAGSRIETTGAD